MTTPIRIIVITALLLHVLVIWSLCRTSARAERAARERKRAMNESLTNRRLS
jgi:hypothetical protein